ncbi:MAG: hypothetical protein IJN48_03910 [Clostridia bacterium]|nr:hypothetical protein [Clostridia bacterium]
MFWESLFSGSLVKKIPQTLKDCTKPSLVTETLWQWAQNKESCNPLQKKRLRIEKK